MRDPGSLSAGSAAKLRDGFVDAHCGSEASESTAQGEAVLYVGVFITTWWRALA